MSLGGPSPPLSVILSWPPPNYVDPISQGSALTIINIISIVLGVCVVSARIYARIVITKAPGVDDIIVGLGLAFAVAFSVLQIVAAESLGVGRHIWDVLPSNGSAIRQNLFISQWCYAVSMASIKISILLLYKRLSGAFTNKFLWASWIGIAYNILYAISYCLILLVECHPVDAYWLSFDRLWAADHTYHCSTMERTVLPTFASLSVLGDIYSTILPLTLVSSLHLPLRRRVSLYALFALGFTVAGAGILRTWYIYHTANKTYDTSWWMSPALFWITFEMYLALVCACAPALKPFFKKFLIGPIKQYSSRNTGTGQRYHDGSVERHASRTGWSTAQASLEDTTRLSSEVYEMTDSDNRHPQREDVENHIDNLSLSPALANMVGRRPSQSHSDGSGALEPRPKSFIAA